MRRGLVLYILYLSLIKDFKKLILKSITDLCDIGIVIKKIKNFESVKKNYSIHKLMPVV